MTWLNQQCNASGPGVKKLCQAYFEELIAVVSTLFTECQNSTPFRRYDQFNFRGFDFCIGKRGVILVIFSLFLPIESSILMLKTPKLSLRKLTKFRQKCHFLQKCDLFKITFCVIT